MEHTPGPWTIRYRAAGASIIGTDEHGTLAKVQMHRSKTSNLTEMKANSRLIAAAPEMYDALKNALQALLRAGPHKWHREIAAARAALRDIA